MTSVIPPPVIPPPVIPPSVIPPPSQEYVANREALLKHTSMRGYQVASLLAPPLYVATVLTRRKPFAMNNLLRATWVAGVGGTAAGLGVGWMQYNQTDNAKLQAARTKLDYDEKAIRLDDHSTIGVVVMAALTPALFYGRAKLVHSILGGAGVGAGLGVMTHYWKTFQER